VLYGLGMLTPSEVEEILTGGRELRNFEVKGAGSRADTQLVVKVIRAGLSMGNLRDGGYVLIGLDDQRLEEMQPGLTEDQAASWSFDDVARKLSEYSDPPLVFDLSELALTNGACVVLMEVSEFIDVPHICARHYDGALRKGALYVRSRGAAETIEVSDPVEMREVIDLAAEKALRRFVETTTRAGLNLSASSDSEDNAETAFDEQRREAFE
jgi:predicted HTH transcriptional regulator